MLVQVCSFIWKLCWGTDPLPSTMAVGRIHFCVQCWKEHWLLSVNWRLSSGPCRRDLSNVETCFIKMIKPRRQERAYWQDESYNCSWPYLGVIPHHFCHTNYPNTFAIFGKLLGSAQAQARVGYCNKAWRQRGRGHVGLLRNKSTSKGLLNWFLKQKRWSPSTGGK